MPITTLLAILCILFTGACNSGLDETRTGPVLAGALCTPAGGPAASSPDACAAGWYDAAHACAVDADCPGGHCGAGLCVTHDLDGDGLDDALEAEVAQKNFPALFAASDEDCGNPLGVVYRVRRHPDRPSRLAVTYVVLYDQDCGSVNGHLGDNEAFAITVDLDARPGAAATVGVRAWAHLNTACQSVTSCQTAPGTAACGNPVTEGGPPEIVVYSSGNKHANYVYPGICDRNCFDTCDAGKRLDGLPLVNAGEPVVPMCTDLTVAKDGFITLPGGWDSRLLDANPWSPGVFGDAGHIARQLTDLVAPAGL